MDISIENQLYNIISSGSVNAEQGQYVDFHFDTLTFRFHFMEDMESHAHYLARLNEVDDLMDVFLYNIPQGRFNSLNEHLILGYINNKEIRVKLAFFRISKDGSADDIIMYYTWLMQK